MRLLSSEAKDWRSRVVSEAEQVLCRESAEAAHCATEVQEAKDKQFQADGDKLKQNSECKSNCAQAQTLATRLRDNELEHQQLRTAQERQLQLEAQTLRRSQDLEQQACNIAHEREIALRELRRQAEEQPKC